jgi:hypothetical protein
MMTKRNSFIEKDLAAAQDRDIAHETAKRPGIAYCPTSEAGSRRCRGDPSPAAPPSSRRARAFDTHDPSDVTLAAETKCRLDRDAEAPRGSPDAGLRIGTCAPRRAVGPTHPRLRNTREPERERRPKRRVTAAASSPSRVCGSGFRSSLRWSRCGSPRPPPMYWSGSPVFGKRSVSSWMPLAVRRGPARPVCALERQGSYLGRSAAGPCQAQRRGSGESQGWRVVPARALLPYQRGNPPQAKSTRALPATDGNMTRPMPGSR